MKIEIFNYSLPSQAHKEMIKLASIINIYDMYDDYYYYG